MEEEDNNKSRTFPSNCDLVMPPKKSLQECPMF